MQNRGVNAIQEASTRQESSLACVVGTASALGRQVACVGHRAAVTGMLLLSRGSTRRLLPSKRPGKPSGCQNPFQPQESCQTQNGAAQQGPSSESLRPLMAFGSQVLSKRPSQPTVARTQRQASGTVAACPPNRTHSSSTLLFSCRYEEVCDL